MINLLPPQTKDAYLYAHKNVRLVRWVVSGAIGFALLGVLGTAGLIYVHQSTQASVAEAVVKQRVLDSQQQAKTVAQVKDISGSLKLAVQVLSKEVLFSKLLTHLATITPNNAVMTDLTIAPSQSAVDITALATDYAAATQLQVNLADQANALFSKADIVSITCGLNVIDPHYPCTVTIRALFVTAKNNPYLFSNDGKAPS